MVGLAVYAADVLLAEEAVDERCLSNYVIVATWSRRLALDVGYTAS